MMDLILYSIAGKVEKSAVVYFVNISDVPELTVGNKLNSISPLLARGVEGT